MFPVLQIGPLSIQAPALIMLIVIWLGVIVVEKTSDRFELSQKAINDLTFYTAIGFIVGARLVFLMRYPDLFLDQPLSALSPSPLLLDWEGGFLIGILAAVVYGQRKDLSLWNTLDAFSPVFSMMIIGAGLARLASGEGYGIPTDLPWGIFLWETSRHPTQVYEAIAGAGVFSLIMWWIHSEKRIVAGEVFLGFAATAAGINLIIDTFRSEAPVFQNGLHVVQIISWLFFVLSLYILMRRKAMGSNLEPGV